MNNYLVLERNAATQTLKLRAFRNAATEDALKLEELASFEMGIQEAENLASALLRAAERLKEEIQGRSRADGGE